MRYCFPVVFQGLETRLLCSAAVVAQIPSQAIVAGQAIPTIDLPAFLDDPTIPSGDTVVDMRTDLQAPDDSIPLELTDAATPETVANFLQYISSGEYANTIVHRSVPGFILQGGGYTTDGTLIHSLGTIPSEAGGETLTNTPGTIAMALGAGGPGTATSEWLFNLTDNTQLNDASDGGPYTVFGQVIYNGLDTLNHIADLPIVNDEANSALSTVPVKKGRAGETVASVAADNFVSIDPVVLPGGVNYSTASSDPNVASASVSDGVLSLAPIGSGTTNITVTATDLGGGKATSTFAVTVKGLATATNFSLGVVKSTAPTQAVLGTPFAGKVTVDVTNQSASTQTGPLSVNLYASANGAIDAGSVLVATLARKSVTIKAGGTLALVIPVKKLPAGLPAGSYAILARSVDGSGGLSGVGTGPALVVAAREVDLADSVVSVPSSVTIGKTTSVSLDVSNSGTIVAAGPLQVSFAVSTSFEGTNPFSIGTLLTHIHLKPGDASVVHLKVSLPVGAPVGRDFLVATIDPANAFSDPDLSNNTTVSLVSFTVS